MTRNEAARAFAKKMGWKFEPAGRGSYFRWRVLTEQCEDRAWRYAYLPAPDAPLHEHLAFVGRVAEAIGADPALYRQRFESDGKVVSGWCVYFEIGDQIEGEGLDLSHAALLAALAALEAR